MRCTVEGCPWPDDPHIPWCGGIPDHAHTNVATHQHLPKKGMGGRNPKSKIVALLCPAMHDLVDNGTRYKNEVIEWEWRRFYRLWDTQNDYRFEGWGLIWRQLDDWTPVTARSPDADIRRVDTSLVRYLQEGPGLDQDADDAGGLREYGDDLQELDRLCRRGMALLYAAYRLKGLEDNWRWEMGDWMIDCESLMGEEAYQYFVPFRRDSAMRQYLWVAQSVIPGNRTELSWSHHRAVAHLPPQGQAEWLSSAKAEGLTSAELAGLLRPSGERERKCCKP